MHEPIFNMSVRQLVELARIAQTQRVWNPAWTDEDGEVIHTPPDDEREVLVFLNGHVDISDDEGRDGGGWGIRMGHFDTDKRIWRVYGRPEQYVTHWMDLPAPPKRDDEEG